MRLIIGIVIGVLIVFNWSTIRALFDASLASQSGGQVEATQPAAASPSAAPAATPPAQPVPPVQPTSLSGMVEQQLKNAAERK